MKLMDKLFKEFYEIYLELAVSEGGEPEGDQTTEPSVEGTEPEPHSQEGTSAGENVADTNTTEPEETKINIDGEEFTLEQIKEFRQGYMRQSDYTKKTQSIASQRKEAEQALEVYNYLKANPHIAQKLVEESEGKVPEDYVGDPRVDELYTEMMTMKIDQDLERLKSQDPELNDVEVLEIAVDKNLTVDDAYKIWKAENFDTMLEKKLKEQSKSLTENIKKNGQITSTMMSGGDKKVDPKLGLSDVEVTVAKQIGMSLEDYAKYKNYKP